MNLRTLAAAAPALLLALPAVSQEPYLRAPNVECAALESLVVFGLIYGGIGGDTTEVSALVTSGDVEACELALYDHGYGEGLLLDSCYGAMELIAFYGPPDAEADPGALIYDLLTGASPESCEMVLRHFDS